MRWLLSALLCLVASGAGAAETMRACTEIGCIDGMILDVSPDHRWPPGHYVFAFKLDGRAVTCTGDMPLKDCGDASLTCDGAGVQITESGCALPKSAQGFGTVMLPNGPARIEYTITRDGRVLIQQTLTPHYTESHPNGLQCGPACRQASAPLFGQ